LEACGVEMVGGMGEPQPADHLSVGACNILEEILYALRSVFCCGGHVGDDGVGRGKWGKVCVGGNRFIIVLFDHIVVDPVLLITATVRVLVVLVLVELVVFGRELWWLRVVPKGGGSS